MGLTESGVGRYQLFVLAWILIALVLGASTEVQASDRGLVLRMRAESLASAGRCDDALDVLARARQATPGSAPLLLLTGQCEIQLQRYEAAAASLAEAQAIDPTLADLDLHVGIVRYHLGDMAGAYDALDAARGVTNDTAQLDLYLGLVLLERAEAREAALAFERARRSNPLLVEPVASYYAGLAWETIDDRERAETALRRVMDYDPDSRWARKADEALARAEGSRSSPLRPGSWRRWGTLTAGLEYDSNVVLRGVGVELVPPISHQADGLGIWSLDGGVEAWRTEDWAAGLMVYYTGNAHFTLTSFDTHAPAATLWLDRRFGEDTHGRLRVDSGYSWVDYEPFLSDQSVTTSVSHVWGKAGSSELSANVYFNQFHFDQGIPARNRDGTGFRVGLEHTYPLGFLRSSVRAGYAYMQYWSEGFEWNYQGHEFRLGYDATLPWQIRLSLLTSYRFLPFDNIALTYIDLATDPFEKRRDNAFRVFTSFDRPINRYLSASVKYAFTLNQSNVRVFNYNRHVIGGYLTVYLR